MQLAEPPTGPTRLAKRVRRIVSPFVRRPQRMFADHVIRRWCKISTQDEMFDPLHVRHYFRVGLGALDCINNSLAVTGKTAVHRILDFGCGHGRILRHLTKAFPDARITATDINRDGVDFCERTFGALGVYSDTSAATVDFHDT